jgi:hypothetical protein
MARRGQRDLIDAVIWVQCDEREAERRVLTRIGKPNESPTMQHHYRNRRRVAIAPSQPRRPRHLVRGT